ncbi:MAG: hypothetical protein Ct9H90mP6_12470 [Gammaproteobacteria bacterium]|nr:MAG: hypothetical protein Ct9H90mP6_12470 [Gammaproteobacteria bacterium]
MESLIVMSLVLAILQIWIIPMVLNMKNMNWLLSNREGKLMHHQKCLQEQEGLQQIFKKVCQLF